MHDEHRALKGALVATGLGVLVVAGWLAVRSLEPPATTPSLEPAAAPQSAPAPVPAAPRAQHPIEAAQGTPDESASAELPALDASDEAAASTLESLLGSRSLALFNLDGFARRVVATVDNLPRRQVPARVNAMRAVPGIPSVSGADATLSLDARNAERYARYVEVATSVEAARLVGAYVRFYPLLERAYRELGYPQGHFNDRVVAAIDDLLAAPEPAAPIALAQPHVLYTFADPELESLSAGQKAMIRMGPQNAARVKAKLAEIRRRLVGMH